MRNEMQCKSSSTGPPRSGGHRRRRNWLGPTRSAPSDDFGRGFFIALENISRRRIILALVERMQAEGIEPVTNEVALAQAWRDPAKQVPMAMLVKATTVYPFGDPGVIGRRCATAGTSDVVDASLAVLADQLDMTILTTDPADIAHLDAAFVEL